MDVLLVLRRTDGWRERLAAGLREVSERVLTAQTTAEAESLIAARRPDVVVFDPSLIELDALDDVRQRHAPTQVLAAWQAVRASRAAAALLTAGADEVLDVTMDPEEWRARLRAALQRQGPMRTLPLAVGRLVLDAQAGEATWNGAVLSLTAREREVLQVLVAAQGRAVRREALYRQVWGWTMARGDRTVDVNVKRLRDKLAQAGVTVQIITQPGVGYRLRDDEQ